MKRLLLLAAVCAAVLGCSGKEEGDITVPGEPPSTTTTGDSEANVPTPDSSETTG